MPSEEWPRSWYPGLNAAVLGSAGWAIQSLGRHRARELDGTEGRNGVLERVRAPSSAGPGGADLDARQLVVGSRDGERGGGSIERRPRSSVTPGQLDAVSGFPIGPQEALQLRRIQAGRFRCFWARSSRLQSAWAAMAHIRAEIGSSQQVKKWVDHGNSRTTNNVQVITRAEIEWGHCPGRGALRW